MDWADLVTLDLSKFHLPGGKDVLAKQLFNALQTIGFFYVVNFGLSQEDVDRQFAIGKSFFELPIEEKLKYRADLENGGYNGYKPLGIRVSFDLNICPGTSLTSGIILRRLNREYSIILRSTISRNSSLPWNAHSLIL